jgi:hypothetical protein
VISLNLYYEEAERLMTVMDFMNLYSEEAEEIEDHHGLH